MAKREHGLSVGSGTLTTAYPGTPISLSLDASLDADSDAFPDRCFVGDLFGEFTVVSTPGTSVTWFLSHDVAGDVHFTDEKTKTIPQGQTTDGSGGVTEPINRVHKTPSSGTKGTKFLFAKLGAGTATLKARVNWEQER